MALIDDFKARFPPPAFATADVDTWEPILEAVYPSYYGVTYDATQPTVKEATLLLLAHLMTIELRTSAGPNRIIDSKSAGPSSESYEAMAEFSGTGKDFYMSTKYGQRFYHLTRFNAAPVAV